MNQDISQYQDLGYTGTGYLLVRVSTASQAIPLSGARVVVRGNEESFSGVIAALVSGEDGLTPKIALLTPPRSGSTSPGGKAFATYNIDITLDGYHALSAQNVPIFDGITSIQPATLIPLPKNGHPDNFSPYGREYTVSEQSAL